MLDEIAHKEEQSAAANRMHACVCMMHTDELGILVRRLNARRVFFGICRVGYRRHEALGGCDMLLLIPCIDELHLQSVIAVILLLVAVLFLHGECIGKVYGHKALWEFHAVFRIVSFQVSVTDIVVVKGVQDLRMELCS